MVPRNRILKVFVTPACPCTQEISKYNRYISMFFFGLTDGLRVAAQHAVMPGLLLLNAALHVAERSVHPLSEALLDPTVVLLHLQPDFT